MDPNEHLQSEIASNDSPDTQRLSDAVGIEPPRLGISHLMVLTACVAVYLGITRGFFRMFAPPGWEQSLGTLQVILQGLHGIGSGAGLAGPILFVTRRRRGWPFPAHPGEYLLVMIGVNTLLGLISTGVTLPMMSRMGSSTAVMWGYAVVTLLCSGINALVFLWAIWRVKFLRWRLCFLVIPLSCFLGLFATIVLARMMGGSLFGVSGVYAGFAAQSLVSFVLIMVLLKDYRDGRRYPWTHWFGAALRVWLDAVALATFLMYLLGGPGL